MANIKADEISKILREQIENYEQTVAVDGAESLLVKQLTPRAQESLVAAFVKSLEGRPN